MLTISGSKLQNFTHTRKRTRIFVCLIKVKRNRRAVSQTELCETLLFIIPMYLCHNSVVTELVHFNTEIHKHKETDALHVGTQTTRHGNSIVKPVCQNWDEQNGITCSLRVIDKVIERVVIAHQYAKSIVPWYGQQSSGNSCCLP